MSPITTPFIHAQKKNYILFHCFMEFFLRLLRVAQTWLTLPEPLARGGSFAPSISLSIYFFVLFFSGKSIAYTLGNSLKTKYYNKGNISPQIKPCKQYKLGPIWHTTR